jgi:hypothetical protein
MFDRATQRRLVCAALAASGAGLLAGCGGGGGGGGSSSSGSSEPSSFLTDTGNSDTAGSQVFPMGGSSYPAADAQYEQYGQIRLTVGTGGTLTGTLTVYTPSQPTSTTTPATPTPVFVAGSYPITGTGLPAQAYSATGTITLAGTPTGTAPLTVMGTLPAGSSGASPSGGTLTVTTDGQTFTGTFSSQPLT